MNNLIQLLNTLFLIIFGGTNNNKPKYDLHKKTPKNEKYPLFKQTLIAGLLILFLIIFLMICFMIGGTETSKVYNNPGLLCVVC